MRYTLWVLQILLALAFSAAGTFKLMTPYDELISGGMTWAEDFSALQVQLIAVAELVGAIGLVLPMATGIMPALTPIAATCLAVLMGGAVMTHVQRGESFGPPLVLGLIALVVVWGRRRLIAPAPDRHGLEPAAHRRST